jgi:hypothetical protein
MMMNKEQNRGFAEMVHKMVQRFPWSEMNPAGIMAIGQMQKLEVKLNGAESLEEWATHVKSLRNLLTIFLNNIFDHQSIDEWLEENDFVD